MLQNTVIGVDSMKIAVDFSIDYKRRKLLEENKHSELKKAVALSYTAEDSVPKIVASGRGYLADQLIEQAKEAEIPIHQDSKLANTLSKLQVGEAIPSQLYEVVAEILVFVDQMDRIKGNIEE